LSWSFLSAFVKVRNITRLAFQLSTFRSTQFAIFRGYWDAIRIKGGYRLVVMLRTLLLKAGFEASRKRSLTRQPWRSRNR
jgi:hypothetical protein